MGKLEGYFKKHWTVPGPQPLVMSPAEIVEWEREFVYASKKTPASDVSRGGVWLYVDWISPTWGETLSAAVQLAAAKYEEVNTGETS